MKTGNKVIKACCLLASIGFYTSAVICFALEIYNMSIINLALGTVFLGLNHVYIKKCLKKNKLANKEESIESKEPKENK